MRHKTRGETSFLKTDKFLKFGLARLSAIKMLHKKQQQNLHPHYLCPFKYAHDVASTF